ncbi:MAG: hypothetical protein F4133_09265, partial [Gammaproteobacteria bacterium]|nr:hypothetical protein [Gammaproteobacteria bacterium]
VSTAEGAGTASGTIDDDDAPSGIALSVDVTSLSEGAAETEVTVTASVSGGTTFAAAKTVRVTVGGGTSTATSGTGGDYTAVAPFDIVLNAGASSATAAFDLEPLDDTADELDETIEVTGAESGGATVSAATITLTDDDVPELGIAAGAAVIEGAAASFTVNADIAPAAALTVNLDVAATAGFAAAGTTGSQTLTFPAGRTSETYTVSTQGDTTDEPDGTVTVEVETGTGYTVASASDTASVAVEDDDATTVALGRAGTGGIAEDGGEVEVTVTLGRELVAGESVTVPLAVTGATVTTHYTLALKSPGGGTGAMFSTASPHSAQNPAVTLAGAGARTATLVLTAVANTDIESRTVSIGYGTGARAPAGTGLSGGVSATGSLSVPVVDDDAMVTVAAASAAEGSEVAFTVTLPKAAPAGGVTVGYSTADGRGVSADAAYQVATSAADYTAAAEGASITIAQGASTGEIRIATTQDNTYEGDHHFTLTLASTSHFNLGTATAIGTIEDDADAPVFAFSAASTDADEDDGTLTLTVSKTGSTLLGATVSYATKDGTAIGGSDFTAIASTSLAFPMAATSKTITVTITDDGDDEPEESFTVELSSPSDAQLGAQKSHSIEITDNDKTAVTLSAPAGDIAESGGSKVVTVTLGRALSGDETLAVPLMFSGTATFGADYALAAPNPVPAGVTYANLASTDLTTNPPTITFSGVTGAARSATITLSATADSTDEGASESVTVGVGMIATAPDGGASASGTATFNIADDDTATLGIDDASAAEGGTAAFTVGLSTPSDREVTVTATTSDGTATAGADYTSKTEALTIAAGATAAAFNVAIASDSETELDEDFTVTLSDPT